MALSLCGKRILLSRATIQNTIRKNGYIVLVPEIGEDQTEKNPLRHHDGLPEFNNITIENCMASIARHTLEFEAGVKDIETKLVNKQATNPFSDIFQSLETLALPLDLTWGLSKTLYLGNSSRMPTKSYIAIHDRAKRARATKFNSQSIYQFVKAQLEAPTQVSNDEETRLLKKYALEGKLNGLDLSPERRIILNTHLNKLTIERAEFRRKFDLSTKQFQHTIYEPSAVRDFPENLLKEISMGPNHLEGPWKVTLAPTVYKSTMEFCPDREIRWNLWQAAVGRGSGYGNKELATSTHLEEIRYARRDIARAVGYDSFSDMSMETKMAGIVENVTNTFQTLLVRAKPNQEKELVSLYQFATERGFQGARIELWDLQYWRKKQQKTLFNYTEATYKQYFPLVKVLDGLFRLVEKLFNVAIIQRNNVCTWHKDVRFYDIFEPHSSAPIGGFYLDPYVSDEKITTQNGGGWMVGVQNQSLIAENRPLAALIFNFDQPIDRQSYLTFGQVKSVFHRFGLALQHILSRAQYSDLSGASNIEWDAVEVSGHLMCHWLQDASVIESISEHSASGDSLDVNKFSDLLQAERHLAGVDLCKELYLGCLDLELHKSKDYWLDVVKRLWPEFVAFPLDKYDSHACSFTQVFIEEWGAAYYSHVWSRMLAADVFSAFHECKGDERAVVEVGRRFRDTFLALGGSCHASQVFRKFRGRDPSPKALLSSLGLKKVE